MTSVPPPGLATPQPGMARVHKIEILISTLLRVGVIASLTIVITGIVLTFVHHHDYVSSSDELRRVTSHTAVFPNTVPEVIQGVRRFEGRSVVIVGLLLLIATPVLRVAVSIFAFVSLGDWMFVMITTIVLILLLLSFILGKAGG